MKLIFTFVSPDFRLQSWSALRSAPCRACAACTQYRQLSQPAAASFSALHMAIYSAPGTELFLNSS